MADGSIYVLQADGYLSHVYSSKCWKSKTPSSLAEKLLLHTERDSSHLLYYAEKNGSLDQPKNWCKAKCIVFSNYILRFDLKLIFWFNINQINVFPQRLKHSSKVKKKESLYYKDHTLSSAKMLLKFAVCNFFWLKMIQNQFLSTASLRHVCKHKEVVPASRLYLQVEDCLQPFLAADGIITFII